MRHAIVLMTALGLGACQTTSPSPISVPAEISAAIRSTCGVVLTAQSLATVAGMFVPGVQSVAAFAASVCSTLSPLVQAQRVGGPVRMGGVFNGRPIMGTRP